MTPENKELLLKYLCMALPYGVVLSIEEGLNFKLDAKHQGIGVIYPEDCSDEFNKRNGNQDYYIIISGCYYGEDIKPYLRPMSSMTQEEKTQMVHDCYVISLDFEYKTTDMVALWNTPRVINWLLENHFDFMNLISKDLAIEVTEENNPYKE